MAWRDVSGSVDVAAIKKEIFETDSWQQPIINRVDFTTAEPATPTAGTRYINTVTGISNITSTPVTQHNIYSGNGTSWSSFTPAEGWKVFETTSDSTLAFKSGAWAVDSGGVPSDINVDSVSLALLGAHKGGVLNRAVIYGLNDNKLYTKVNNGTEQQILFGLNQTLQSVNVLNNVTNTTGVISTVKNQNTSTNTDNYARFRALNHDESIKADFYADNNSDGTTHGVGIGSSSNHTVHFIHNGTQRAFLNSTGLHVGSNKITAINSEFINNEIGNETTGAFSVKSPTQVNTQINNNNRFIITDTLASFNGQSGFNLTNGNLGIGTTAPAVSLHLQRTNPRMIIHETDATATNRSWGFGAESGEYYMYTADDTNTYVSDIFRAYRTGTTPTRFAIKTNLWVDQDNPTLIFHDSNELTANRSWGVQTENSNFAVFLAQDDGTHIIDAIEIQRAGVVPTLMTLNSSNIFLSGNVGVGTSVPQEDFHIHSTSPAIMLDKLDAALDEKKWTVVTTGTNDLEFRTLNDSVTASSTYMHFERSANAVNVAKILGGNNNRLISSAGTIVSATDQAPDVFFHVRNGGSGKGFFSGTRAAIESNGRTILSIAGSSTQMQAIVFPKIGSGAANNLHASLMHNDYNRNEMQLRMNNQSVLQINTDYGMQFGVGSSTTTTAGVAFHFRAATTMVIPVGTTAQRPTSPQIGAFRYNTTISKFEGYNGAWVSFH